MKSIALTLVMMILSISSFAQIAHDVEIYSEDGEKFTMTMNGRVLNVEPASRVEVQNIEYDFVHLIIDFENEAIESIEKKYFQIANVEASEKDKPVVLVNKIVEKKGEYKLKFASRFNKKIQTTTVIVNQEAPESNGVTISNGKVTIAW